MPSYNDLNEQQRYQVASRTYAALNSPQFTQMIAMTNSKNMKDYYNYANRQMLHHMNNPKEPMSKQTENVLFGLAHGMQSWANGMRRAQNNANKAYQNMGQPLGANFQMPSAPSGQMPSAQEAGIAESGGNAKEGAAKKGGGLGGLQNQDMIQLLLMLVVAMILPPVFGIALAAMGGAMFMNQNKNIALPSIDNLMKAPNPLDAYSMPMEQRRQLDSAVQEQLGKDDPKKESAKEPIDEGWEKVDKDDIERQMKEEGASKSDKEHVEENAEEKADENADEKADENADEKIGEKAEEKVNENARDEAKSQLDNLEDVNEIGDNGNEAINSLEKEGENIQYMRISDAVEDEINRQKEAAEPKAVGEENKKEPIDKKPSDIMDEIDAELEQGKKDLADMMETIQNTDKFMTEMFGEEVMSKLNKDYRQKYEDYKKSYDNFVKDNEAEEKKNEIAKEDKKLKPLEKRAKAIDDLLKEKNVQPQLDKDKKRMDTPFNNMLDAANSYKEALMSTDPKVRKDIRRRAENLMKSADKLEQSLQNSPKLSQQEKAYRGLGRKLRSKADVFINDLDAAKELDGYNKKNGTNYSLKEYASIRMEKQIENRKNQKIQEVIKAERNKINDAIADYKKADKQRKAEYLARRNKRIEQKKVNAQGAMNNDRAMVPNNH